jgi:RNA polymerase sigma-70 factor, ECF subfamily
MLSKIPEKYLNWNNFIENRIMALMEKYLSVDDEFVQLLHPYQAELLVHCYRILGSQLDAEDALQETLIHAWRRQETLRDRAALRAWLYRIATNASLDMLDRRKRRGLSSVTDAPSNPEDALPAPVLEPVWLEPLADEYLHALEPGPEARYDVRESVGLAFLALLQQLPGKQRAVFILRDVLGWKAEEAAELLETSVAGVNSALQRARLTLDQHRPEWMERQRGPEPRMARETQDALIADLLERYRRAWENEDASGLVLLLREDAVLSMPPVPSWYLGRENIELFYQTHLFAPQASGRFRLLPTRANACPAFGVYQKDGSGQFVPSTLQVITLGADGIREVNSFVNNQVDFYKKFGLPPSC